MHSKKLIKLSIELWDKISREAKLRDITVTALMKIILNEYFEKKK